MVSPGIHTFYASPQPALHHTLQPAPRVHQLTVVFQTRPWSDYFNNGSKFDLEINPTISSGNKAEFIGFETKYMISMETTREILVATH